MGHFGVRDIITKNRISRMSDPARPALVFEERYFTYAELESGVDRLAAALAARGFERGDRLAVMLYNRPEYVELLFAVSHLGGVIVPLNYFLKPPEVAYALADSGASWLVAEPELRHALPALADLPDRLRLVMVDEAGAGEELYADLLANDLPAPPQAAVGLEEPVLFQYTSGTTGYPKAAVHSHGTVLFNALTQVVEFGIDETDVHLVIPALCWGAGFHDYTLATWWRGGTVVLRPSRGFSGSEFCGLIERHRVTTTLLVPSVMKIVIEDEAFERADLSTLRIVLSGGEPIPVSSIEALQERLPDCAFIQAYGLSEFPVITTFLDGADAISRRGSAGKATLGALVRVVDEEGNDVPPGESGEIISRSPASMLAYHGKDAETGTALRDGWLHTGDRARVDEDGFISIDGRVKDMIISGGLNVYPAEIERVLESHPGVAEVAVVGTSHPRYGEAPFGIVVPVDGATVDEEELAALARTELATFKVPVAWRITSEPLPRTASGKVKKHLLREVVPPFEIKA